MKYFSLILFCLLGISMMGQNAYCPDLPSSTANMVLIGIPKIGGEDIPSDAVINGFDMDGQCIGIASTTVNGGTTYFLLTARGDDGSTPEDEGLLTGEEFVIRLFRTSNDEVFELPGITFEFINTNGAPVDNDIYPFNEVYSFVSAALPVVLKSFDVECSDQSFLKWETETEVDFAGFEIEASIDGKEFSSIGWEAAKGHASSYSYSLSHNSDRYFRLKMIDIDGSFEYSEMVYCKPTGRKEQLVVYPNPTSGQLTLVTPNTDGDTEVEIVDITGRTLIHHITNNGSSQSQIDVSMLAAGSYYLRIVKGYEVEMSPFSKL